MVKFKVGDAVRVKAGSPNWMEQKTNGLPPFQKMMGRELLISKWNGTQDGYASWFLVLQGNPGQFVDQITENYLEPWNDAEEWDGSKWVAKKTEAKPCIVAKRGCGDGALLTSTKLAFREAENLAGWNPGTEYVVYQEKGSVKREKKTPPFNQNDFVRAIRDTSSFLGAKVAEGQVVRVMQMIGAGDERFSGSPVAGSGAPSLPIADFEKIL